MKTQKKCTRIFLLAKLLFCIPILFTNCAGGSDTPMSGGIAIKPLVQGNPLFCENKSVGQMCLENKGSLQIRVIATAGSFNNWLYYSNTSNVSNGVLSPTVSVGVAQTWEGLQIGTPSTNDQIIVSVPKKRGYEIHLKYIEFGYSMPVGSQAICPNLPGNHCWYLEKTLSFKKKVYPTAAKTIIDMATATAGSQAGCSY